MRCVTYRIGRMSVVCQCILSHRVIKRRPFLRCVTCDIRPGCMQGGPYCLPCPTASPMSRKPAVVGRLAEFAVAADLSRRRVHSDHTVVEEWHCKHRRTLRRRVSIAPFSGFRAVAAHQSMMTADLGLLQAVPAGQAPAASAGAWH